MRVLNYLDINNIKIGLKLKHRSIHGTYATIIYCSKDSGNFTVSWDNNKYIDTKYNVWTHDQLFFIVEEQSSLEEPCSFCKKMNNIGVSVCWSCTKVISK